jgi:hypothetical protein
MSETEAIGDAVAQEATAEPTASVHESPASPGPTYRFARRWFRRGLALVAGIAILSLWVQIDGLVGSKGILPAADAHAAHRAEWGDDWTWRPTLIWFDASDAALHGLCAVGVVLAVLMLLDVAPALCALLLWAVYLSLSWAGGVFMHFQWDTLLVETLLLAAVWLPWRLGRESREPDRKDPELSIGLWLLWFLLFRFMFESGVVKLTSGDPTWANRTAMSFHYMTQPLPHGLSWFAYHLPMWMHRLSANAMFFIELVVPWFIFLPALLRRLLGVSYGFAMLPRRMAALLMVGLQVVIGATGNYGFFGLLTIVLCLTLVDDGLFRSSVQSGQAEQPVKRKRAHLVRWALAVLFAAPVLALGTSQLLDLDADWAASVRNPTREQIEAGIVTTLREDGPAAGFRLAELRARPWLSVNAYGLFRVMTTRRPEIRVQGTADGEAWVDYDFQWKVDEVFEHPGWVQPHMPRLDWQLWFEALRWERFAFPPQPYQPSPWFASFLDGLLNGEPEVVALLAIDPFEGDPPLAVRATLVDLRFTTPGERAEMGAWWVRESIYPTWMKVTRED